MTDAIQIDRDWLMAHPLPHPEPGTDKNSRGRVLAVGGAEFVPGALLLTGEAALRAGAGKLRLATVERAAMALAVQMPEAAMIALPADADGELAQIGAAALLDPLTRSDALILGPGMSARPATYEFVKALISEPHEGLAVVLDAAALSVTEDLRDEIKAHDGRIILTPHHGEMAVLTGRSYDEIETRPDDIAREVAGRLGAIVVLKSDATRIAAPDGTLLSYGSDCVGLATGGSGDVLAGIIGGLLSRGVPPIEAAAWGVCIHGEAGRAAAARIGPVGFLARDLLGGIPGLMASLGAGDIAF